jgi:acyl-CoA reductase-like NAD-dependent aldehyde dehydrogenase
MNAATPPLSTATPQSTIHHSSFDDVKVSAPAPSTSQPAPDAFSESSLRTKSSPTVSTSLGSATAAPPRPSSASGVSSAAAAAEAAEEKEKRRKMTAEQREKMDAYDKERIEEKRERIRSLASKLRDRIRPFVEASKPGDNDDPETQR